MTKEQKLCYLDEMQYQQAQLYNSVKLQGMSMKEIRERVYEEK